MAGCVDQVDQVVLPVRMPMNDGHRLSFDSNTPFPLHLKLVEELWIRRCRNSARHLQQPIGQRRFPMIDMRNDRQVSNRVSAPSFLETRSDLPDALGRKRFHVHMLGPRSDWIARTGRSPRYASPEVSNQHGPLSSSGP